MLRKLFILYAIFLFLSFLSATEVPMEDAQRVATNWMIERSNFRPGQISVVESFTVKENLRVIYYVFNLTPSGFIIISGDDIAYPVIGYSFEGTYTKKGQPPGFKEWMFSVKENIENAVQLQLTPNQQTAGEWVRLKTESTQFQFRKNSSIKSESINLSSQWNQDWPYNQFAPPAPPPPEGLNGYNEHCPAGCVAVAMGQIMRFHEYPTRGRGSHSYQDTVRLRNGQIFWNGTLQANFGQTTYDWNNMTDELSINSSQTQIDAVSTLIYHCGVAVNMDYQPRGSGASITSARNAFVNFFNYSIQGAIIERNVFNTHSQWLSLLKDEIENDRPIYYRGSGTGGHAFVMHGYQGAAHFYFNWGWDGSHDGYFFLNDLTPGTHNFNNSQHAIVNIDPTPNSQQNDNSPVMFIYQRRWEVPTEGGSTDPIFVVNSNPISNNATINFNIASNVPWLTTNTMTGTTPSSFVITADSNITGDQRTGEITITSTTSGVFSGSATQTIMVKQPASGERAVDVALVLDRSGSMNSSNYIGRAKNAAKTFVGFMKVNDNLAVTSFSSSASVNFPLTKITSEAVKTAAQNAINAIYASGSTSIGAGILAGQNELNKGRIEDHQGMILLSDGYENTSPYVASVLPTIPQNTDIYTIALGPNSDINLLNYIAAQTGGEFYYAPDATKLQEIYNFIRGAITEYQTIATFIGTLSPGSTESFSVPIDGLTQIAQFSVSFPSGNIDLELVTPQGNIIDSSTAAIDPNIEYSKGSTYCFIKIKSPLAGNWEQRIVGTNLTNTTSFDASIQGVSDLNLESFFDKKEYEAGQPIIINSLLMNGYDPIVGAQVIAEIQRPSSSMASRKNLNSSDLEVKQTKENLSEQNKFFFYLDTLLLYDDGLHSDGTANDGLYSNVYTNTYLDGSYIVKIRASGTIVGIGEFKREYYFSTTVKPSNRPYVPSLIEVKNGAKNVPLNPVLRWEEVMNADRYELQITNILNTPQSATPITVIDTLVSEDSIRITGLEKGKTYYWRVRSIGSSSLMSDWSEEWSFSTIFFPKEENYCYPNPFDPTKGSLKIRFALLKDSNVKIKIYDASNTLVKEFQEFFNEGINELVWDGRNETNTLVANGVYIYFIKSEHQETFYGKIAVLK